MGKEKCLSNDEAQTTNTPLVWKPEERGREREREREEV
jgi:hypothetical protein